MLFLTKDLIILLQIHETKRQTKRNEIANTLIFKVFKHTQFSILTHYARVQEKISIPFHFQLV